MGQRHSARDGNTTLVLLLEHNVGRLLVDSDPKSFQFGFDDLLVDQGLVDVKHDENEVASFGHGNNLSTTTLTILCTLNDTRKVENLDLGPVVHHLSGHGGQGCEFVRRGYNSQSSILCLSSVLRENEPSECWPVKLLMRVLLPTDGKPIKPLPSQYQSFC